METKYIVWGKMPLGAGYLRIENGKRHWGSYFDAQSFTADEIDEVLSKIGREWAWKCYVAGTNDIYKQHEAHYIYV
jgi:hypothetical protein